VAATEEEVPVEVEPKVEPVEPVIVPWTEETRKTLKITTHRVEDKDVIEILDSDDEMPGE
jgi:hypothetical protein